MNPGTDAELVGDVHGGAWRLPTDAVLLPLTHGELLVSRRLAVFCRIPPEAGDAIRSMLAHPTWPPGLPPDLERDLRRHGLFGPARPAPPPAPSVQIQLTNACSLSCAYCCTNSGAPRHEELSREEVFDAVRQIPVVLGHGARVALLGGEPLLVPWVADLASEIVDLGLRLTIFTNGLPLCDPALAQRVARLVLRGVQVRVSLAGPSRAACDGLSGKPRFDDALRGLDMLTAHGGRASVDLMLTPEQVESIAHDLPSLRKRLPAGCTLALGALYRSGRETGAHLFGNWRALDAALDRIAFEAGERVDAFQTAPVVDRRDGCSCALGWHLHLRSDGALFNCFKMEEQVGHLRGDGFRAAARWLRGHPHRASDLFTCADCPLASLCGAGCRSENLLYSGDPDLPVCGAWRVRVLSELLAEDRTAALEWPLEFLLQEAHARGIEAPASLTPRMVSRHLVDV